MTTPDKIEKKTVLKAPIARVWKAISEPSQFGSWFGVAFAENTRFEPGKAVSGKMTPTKVDADVAKRQEPYAGKAFDITIDRVEENHLFSFRWHPFALEVGVDYSQEPTTLVVFELREVPGGTQLVITESGFDRIPLERRAKAFAANDGGWTKQAELVEKYLA